MRKNSGVTLLEIMIAIAILGYILLAFTQVFMKNNMALTQSKMYTLASNWAADGMEDVKTYYYDDISTGTWTTETEVLGETKEFSRVIIVSELEDSLKEIAVTISWTELGKNKNVRIVSLVADYTGPE
ncbi:MAG: prepilin-type N-terminal cleavage/methylation domain-containing protein [Elusimicrobiota bacterium]